MRENTRRGNVVKSAAMPEACQLVRLVLRGGKDILEMPGDVGAMVVNIVVVTAGNVVGGVVLVAAVYWFVYLRPRGT